MKCGIKKKEKNDKRLHQHKMASVSAINSIRLQVCRMTVASCVTC